ncbi:MAG: hypothetical protein K2J95_08970 [Lachnospiraceae bacterium]|nr:hypothetical protein [Lachnospiraceae bacterium]
MKITFSDNLITGNKAIDDQHRELISRIDQFIKVCENKDGKVTAKKSLFKLTI